MLYTSINQEVYWAARQRDAKMAKTLLRVYGYGSHQYSLTHKQTRLLKAIIRRDNRRKAIT